VRDSTERHAQLEELVWIEADVSRLEVGLGVREEEWLQPDPARHAVTAVPIARPRATANA
jgi:hypothetical protein